MILSTIHYALRQLRKSPAFTATVIGTLALCIGANTAIYTIVDALFFRPLPYASPERLVLLTTVFGKNGAFNVDTSQTGVQWEDIRDHADMLDRAVYGSSGGLNLVAERRIEYVQNQRISANFFRVLGVTPVIGREFTPQEDVPNGPPLAILSYPLWLRVFHGDRSVVGRSITLRGKPYEVVGVAPADFWSLPAGFGSNVPPDVWTPLQPSTKGEGSGDNYGVIGRLRPGVSLAQANGQLNSIMRDTLSHIRPQGITVEEKAIPLQNGITYEVRSGLYLLWAAVGIVLLIGCVNIAGILIARSTARSRELATRLALGASRIRLVSELLVEAMLLAFFGGAAGIFLGQYALEGLLKLNPDAFILAGPVHLNWPVLTVMLAASLATSLVFGLLPALEASAVDLRSVLSEAGRGNAGSRRQWKRQSLVFVEVVLGVVLVVAAGLLIRSFTAIAGASPGFDARNVTIASASLQEARYATTAEGARLFRDTLERIRAIRGVESAAVALTSPYSRPLNEGLALVNGRPTRDGVTEFTYATPGLFETLHIKLKHGRAFNESDSASGARVAVVNDAFLRRYLHDTVDPVGVPVKIENKEWRIIGVVNNVQEKNGFGPGGPIDYFPEVYVPVEQFPDGIFQLANMWFSPVWIVRTHTESPRLPQQMQRALASVDPELPFSSFHSMSEVRSSAFQEPRYRAIVFSMLAGLATLLTSLGLYGLIAQSVSQRTREMGIRLALGATVRQLISSAVSPGLILSATGIMVGTLLAIGVAKLLGKQFSDVAPLDPETFVTVSLFLLGVAILASLLPALRLTRLDPAQTLRHD